MTFDHIGLIMEEKKEKENWVEATRIWVTDPKEHLFNVEWLRFEPDSPVKCPVRKMPHIAYRVDDIKAAADGLKVLLELFNIGFAVVRFYESKDGAVIEFIQY